MRLARGLYTRPRSHPLLGPLAPSANEIANALAGKGSLRLQPSGAYAANLPGLTEQPPLKLVFLTDGASRTVQIGKQTITLKHTTPRNMATAGRISGLVIQALRHLKQPNVDEQEIKQISKSLSNDDKAVLLADASLAPAWIASIRHRIAKDQIYTMQSFLQLPSTDQKLVIEQTAAQMGWIATSIEKDFWVRWTLQQLFGPHISVIAIISLLI